MDVKTRWNSTLGVLERSFQLREFLCEWVKIPKCSDYRPLFTTQDEWTIGKYVMEVLRPFRILDAVDVDKVYSHIASGYHSVQWYDWSHGWHDVSYGYEKDSMEGRLVLCCEVSSTEGVQIILWSDSIDWHESLICTYRRSFPEVVMI